MIRSMALAAALVLAFNTAALAAPKSLDPAQMPAGDYVMDTKHASLTAKVAHMGFSNFAVRFDGLDGAFTYDPAQLAVTKVTVTVDTKVVHTGVGSLDKELVGQSYFDVAKFPAVTFVSTKVDAGPDGKGTISGDLTLLGVTKPVTLAVVFHGFGPGMMGTGTRLGFSGTTQIKRSDFGLTTMSKFVGDDVAIDFEVEFYKK